MEFRRGQELPWPYSGYTVHQAQTDKKCAGCGRIVNPGERYYRGKRSFDVFPGYFCLAHIDLSLIVRHQQYMANRPATIVIGTDASGPVGERWAFVVYRVYRNGRKQELYREHGETPGYPSVTITEGIALVKALDWAGQAIRNGMIREGEAIQVGSDNSAVHAKLRTGGIRGYAGEEVWRRLMELREELKPRLVVEIDDEALDEADRYARAHAFRESR